MHLGALMSRDVCTVREDAPAEAAHRLMLSRGIHHLVVVRRGRVAGVVSSRDLGGPRGAAVRHHRLVSELMTPTVVHALAATSVREAARVMRGRHLGCLPVVEGRRVVGIVTVSDLLTAMAGGIGLARPRPQGPARLRRKESR